MKRPKPAMNAESRVSVVVLTHDRVRELERTLWRLQQLPEKPPIVVVDNGCTDGTAERVRERFPRLRVTRSERNLGAAGRNLGVDCVQTPYVAFCDDDCWWEAGALARAAELFDQHPRLAALAARVLVGDARLEDPTCERMAASPLRASGLPGPALIGFMAGAVVMRVAAYREVGGYEPRLFIGGEERLMGLDLAARGWHMAYVPELVVHHHPSALRDAAQRSLLLARNELWIACLRLPWRSVWREARRGGRSMQRAGRLADWLPAVARGLPWCLRERRVVPAPVEAMHRAVLHSEVAGAPC
jgi:GT2 family glycosyltransferase